MSDSFDIDPPEDDLETLAAEYVLGLLTVAQLPHVVALRRHSLRFDQAVRRWELRLVPLAESLEPVAPGPRVWAAISAGIAPRKLRGGFWDSLAFWRGFGVTAGAVCAVLVAVMLVRSPSASPAPSATAMLASRGDGVFVATAAAAADGTRLIISPSQVTMPAGKSAELWLIMPGSEPAPLGLLSADRPVAMIVPAAELGGGLGAAELAVSIEPAGGSPTGKPTGPVIATGRFLSL